MKKLGELSNPLSVKRNSRECSAAICNFQSVRKVGGRVAPSWNWQVQSLSFICNFCKRVKHIIHSKLQLCNSWSGGEFLGKGVLLCLYEQRGRLI